MVNLMSSEVLEEITYWFPNFNSNTIKVWEQINNFIPPFIIVTITYPGWDSSLSMLVKGVPER